MSIVNWSEYAYQSGRRLLPQANPSLHGSSNQINNVVTTLKNRKSKMSHWAIYATILGFAPVVLSPSSYAQEENPSLHLVEVRKVWDEAPHNAFTDLIRFENRWFLVFREGDAHVSPDGSLRILVSDDGESWDPAAVITSPTADLRDAKFSITPEGKLMLLGVEALHDRSRHSHQSAVWFSDDGYNWTDKHVIGDPDFWIWRLTWHEGLAYGIGYSVNQDDRLIRLYSSADGLSFDTLAERLFDVGYPNETSIVFDGDTAYCLLRRDGTPSSGMLGRAQPPYTNWSWQDLGMQLGGPHLVTLPDGRLLAASRRYIINGTKNITRTGLLWLDPQAGRLTEAIELPSGGDTSYPGLVLHDGMLWVSYYSSHEGKTAIYLAQVEIGN
jgi:hypothetical protein